jgi:4-amino-4-deoxy-L-arabinose transferase-like glycosyltransferase
MPLSHLGQAAWYKLAGFGLFRMRFYHILWGLAALASWAFIVRTLAGSWAPALLAAFLVAVDRGFVNAAASGRPDMMSAALGALAIAAYLALRERRLGAAFLASQTLLAAALFTHPIGSLAGFAILVLVLRFDFRRLRWQYLLLAAAPYVVGFGLWGLYISRDPEAFRSQFGSNAAGREGGLLSPVQGIVREIRVRFLERMYLPPYATGVRRVTVLIPILYALAAIALLFRRHGPRLLGIIAVLYFFVFGILEATKPAVYFVHITPLAACCLGVWAWLEWSEGRARRWAAVGVVALLVALQTAWIAYACWQDPYRRAYLPAMAFLDRHGGSKASIMGSSELGFHFGFYNNVTDDTTLGYYTGKRPDFIVVDFNGYAEAFKGFPSLDPGLSRYIRKTLTEDYQQVYANPVYTIYRRR